MFGKDWRKNKTKEELELHNSRIFAAYNSKSDEEKQAMVEKMLKTKREWSDEKREQVRKKQRESQLNMAQETRQQRKVHYRQTWFGKSKEERDAISRKRARPGDTNGTYGSKFMYKGQEKPIRVMPKYFDHYLKLGYKFSNTKFIYRGIDN